MFVVSPPLSTTLNIVIVHSLNDSFEHPGLAFRQWLYIYTYIYIASKCKHCNPTGIYLLRIQINYFFCYTSLALLDLFLLFSTRWDIYYWFDLSCCFYLLLPLKQFQHRWWPDNPTSPNSVLHNRTCLDGHLWFRRATSHSMLFWCQLRMFSLSLSSSHLFYLKHHVEVSRNGGTPSHPFQ